MPKSSPLIVIVILLVFTSACNLPASRKATPQSSSESSNIQVDTFPVDPIFQDLYEFLGGESMAGPAIAPIVDSGDLKTQYIQAAQMVYDPSASESDRFQLESLGRILGVAEPAVPDPGIAGVRYSNGHIILEEFVPVYDQLGGARFVGRPLTEGRHNPEKRRIEQYFENLGFYRLENEKPGTVHLMAYGAMACPQDCRSQPPTASIPSSKGYLPPPFSTVASRLGLDFTGLTLSSPHPGEDGRMEVIFENLVLEMDQEAVGQATSGIVSFQLWLPEIISKISIAQQSEYSLRLWLPVTFKIVSGDRMMARIEFVNPLWLPLMMRGLQNELGQLHLKPIVQMLGIEPGPPVPPKDDPLSVFYPTQGELGYHVPIYFDEYLKRFGGIQVAGNPITEVFYLEEDDVYRQCFTNLCLDFKPGENSNLHPAPLGVEYKKQYYSEPRPEPKWREQGDIRLTLFEGKTFVSPGESHEIQVVVTENSIPLANREPVLTITLPDGTQQVFYLEPTDELGTSRFTFPPIPARNSTLIPYEICVPTSQGELCVEDHYAVWDKD